MKTIIILVFIGIVFISAVFFAASRFEWNKNKPQQVITKKHREFFGV